MPRTPADVQTWLATHDPLRIVPLIDPVIETVGHQPRSTYAETTGAVEMFEPRVFALTSFGLGVR